MMVGDVKHLNSVDSQGKSLLVGHDARWHFCSDVCFKPF